MVLTPIGGNLQPTEFDIPTMMDISNCLKKVGKPGEKREEKKKAVTKLFMDRHISPINFQGFHIIEDLESYSEY